MLKKISAALISVFYKDGLEPLAKKLQSLGVTIYSTGGTQKFLEEAGVQVVPVESLTSYPSILGGRVKTLHPVVFGGILGRRALEQDRQEMQQYKIPEIDLVIVDLYPFEETVASTKDESQIIEKIDIGGPSMIRAAAKNFSDVAVVASKDDYKKLEHLLSTQDGGLSLEQRRSFAAKAFEIVAGYDVAISEYFNPATAMPPADTAGTPLRYGENPHQQARFYGDMTRYFEQLHGKEISYNNLVDIDAAIALISEWPPCAPSAEIADEYSGGGAHHGESVKGNAVFAIIKHTNVCGVASRETVELSWQAALAGDPESAFGGVLVCNGEINAATAAAINEIFFEVLIAPSFSPQALEILQSKKNRILLQLKNNRPASENNSKSILNGILEQTADEINFEKWEDAGGRPATAQEKADLEFANIICKHLKSNAIALVKYRQLVGKGCGQTSRIDALRQAIDKARQFNFDLGGAVMASDAFFPFDDCVRMGHQAGIQAFIQPGGSIRDKDSIAYCEENGLAMVLTGTRHFKH